MLCFYHGRSIVLLSETRKRLQYDEGYHGSLPYALFDNNTATLYACGANSTWQCLLKATTLQYGDQCHRAMPTEGMAPAMQKDPDRSWAFVIYRSHQFRR